ncbi:N-acetyl sugar amidotransferase [Hyphomonas sp.]|uniref:N-acetyl sugar amidotransferase n=1 Tax=Hyphomonas sp. TaxID=87 RepID=UPI0025B8B6FC|nr:N-acetyl sugar amidotransferase [Hyphomonas sp.]
MIKTPTVAWMPDGKVRDYRVCTRCVMDTTDPDITFDAAGVCSNCHRFETSIRPYWKPDAAGAAELDALLHEIRTKGAGKPYDCIIGLSGGVDSSFLATKLLEWKLRPLVVHVDAGWNSELAVNNIEMILSKLGLHLDTVVIDWNEMRDLQRAFLKSHVANQDIPQDHAYTAALVRKALEHDIRYVISGTNFATEGVLPQGWGYDAMDATQLRDIHRRFGEGTLKAYPVMEFQDYFGTMQQRLRFIAPLNFMPYDKTAAIAHLEQNFGWRYYGGKHYESIWTRWFQAHYLPTKFGYDKRKAHLSSLIVAGSMTREAALRELDKPLYTDNELTDDTAFVAKKLGLTVDELEGYLTAPPRHYSDYSTNAAQIEQFCRRKSRKARLRQIATRFSKDLPRRIAGKLSSMLASPKS